LVGIVEIAMLPDVIDLVNHHRAVVVASIGDAAKVGNHCVVRVAKVATGEDAGGVGGDRLADDHRGAAPGALGVIAQVALTGQAGLCHVGGVGAEIEPVLEGLVTQIQGREQMGKQR
jgi:hypothetical protein